MECLTYWYKKKNIYNAGNINQSKKKIKNYVFFSKIYKLIVINIICIIVIVVIIDIIVISILVMLLSLLLLLQICHYYLFDDCMLLFTHLFIFILV